MIKIDTLCEHQDNANTYIVGNDTSCIVIDPANDPRNIKKLINNRTLLGIFLTHGHYDHFRCLEGLIKDNDIKVFLHKDAYLKLSNSKLSCANLFGLNFDLIIPKDRCVFLKDGETIKLNELEIKTIFTPGHTSCSICLIIDNLLFSGDTLFYNGVGRFDLPTASMHSLVTSIKRLLNMNINYDVYPGHGEMTNILEEAKYNPFYQRIK